MMSRVFRWLTSTIFLLSCLTAIFSGAQPPYDEIRDPEDQVRRPYQRVVPEMRQPLFELLDPSGTPFRGNHLRPHYAPLPRMLSYEEHQFLMSGMEQRGRAIRALMLDLQSQQPRITTGVRPTLAPEIMRDIMLRYHFAELRPYIREDNIGALIGGDIIRGPDGNFFILEDNVGSVGGLPEMMESRKEILESSSGMRAALEDTLPVHFHDELIKHYKKNAAGKSLVVVIPEELLKKYPNKKNYWASQGVEVVVLNKDYPMGKGNELVITDKGVQLRQASINDGTNLREVGEVINFFDAKHLKHSGGGWAVPGLLEAYRKGLVQLANSPGVDIINDKEIHTHMESIIRFYLHEEPIIRNVPGSSFRKVSHTGGNSVVDQAWFERVFNDLDRFVIKGTTGGSGQSVWLGKSIRHDEQAIAALKRQILQNPGNFVAQVYVNPSQFMGHITDLRTFVHIDEHHVWASDGYLSRLSPIHTSHGKLNTAFNKGSAYTLTSVFVCIRQAMSGAIPPRSH